MRSAAMNSRKNLLTHINDVSSTSLATLYCRATESRSAKPILDDPKAESIMDELMPHLAASKDPLHRKLARGKLSGPMVVHIAMRARKYDRYAQSFLSRRPDGVVINLGCGMDTRFDRIDDGRLEVFDLDLPELIAFKRQFLSETERYHFISSSVTDLDWLEVLEPVEGRPAIFLAEGLFMYLPGDAVRELVCRLCDTQAAGSELVCEMFNARWLRGFLKAIVDRKLRGSLAFGAGAAFRFGIESARELESWHPSISLLDEWSYLDEDESKLGALRLMGKVDIFRRLQWTTHYALSRA
jgi:methyltransferase (TIGR00027 family)